MAPTRTGPIASDESDPAVVLAADENYAMPLAATVRSALDNLTGDRRLRLYLLDGGVRDSTKRRLELSWPAGRFDATWIDVDPTALDGVPLSGHINQISYFRILAPRLLPSDLRRVIYLDSDLVVRKDLTRLWNEPCDGAPCLAVQDCAAPYLDASQALANYDKCKPHLGGTVPVPNFRELGLNPMSPYLNGGVLLLDLDAWRREDLPTQMLECLDRNRGHVRWHDQYALNVVLHGRWKKLDHRWNQGLNVFSFPNWARSPYGRHEFEQLRSDPHIIHFTTRHKPWKVSCLHPLREQYFTYLDRTEWAGWRPAWFNHPRTVLELVKTQQRRLRFARRRLAYDTLEWLSSPRWNEGDRAA